MMWNANENIDFNFADFQLDEKINSPNRTTSSPCAPGRSVESTRSFC